MTSIKRRDFIRGSVAAAAGAAAAPGVTRAEDARPYRWIDPEKCVGCGQCVPLCPMDAITLLEKSRIDHDECTECGVCWRSRVCPADAIVPGKLTWPRTLREVFSNPLAKHESTGVPGRGTEGIKTNDSSGRYQRGHMGVFVELGRPARGVRLADVEKVTRKFAARGYRVEHDNPVAALITDPGTGALKPEVLGEKVISCLVEFVLPTSAAAELLTLARELGEEVNTVFNLSIALRADEKGHSPLATLFPAGTFSLPNGKVNLGMAEK